MPVTKNELAELIETAEILTKTIVSSIKEENGLLNVELDRVDI